MSWCDTFKYLISLSMYIKYLKLLGVKADGIFGKGEGAVRVAGGAWL